MQPVSEINEKDLDNIRRSVTDSLSAPRAAHVLSVERTAERMGRILLPGDVMRLRAAALLHDITKEYSFTEQCALCRRYDIPLTERPEDIAKTLHARTGAYVARERFPSIVDREIFLAVFRHTTGDRDMTVFEKIIFLADMIEETRTYPLCTALRDTFFSGVAEAQTAEERVNILDAVCFKALSETILMLVKNDRVVADETIFAYNFLASRQLPVPK